MPTIAIVGCAHVHSPGFVKRIQARNDVRVATVWDREPERANRYAADFQTSVCARVEDIWADKTLTGVVICSKTGEHEELVRGAAEAGLAVFVEKPLGLAGADAMRIADVVEGAGITFQTGYFQRGLAPHLFIRDHIRAGTFGEISRLRITNVHCGAMRGLFTPEFSWMTDPTDAGTGGFGDMGAHALDLMLWLLGDPVCGTATTTRTLKAFSEDCDESGEALLRFNNGTIGSLAAGWIDLASPVTMEVSGSRAHAWIRDRSEVYLTCSALGADGKSPQADLPDAWPHALELFLDKLSGKDVQLVAVGEAARRSAIMEALYDASRTGRWVSL